MKKHLIAFGSLIALSLPATSLAATSSDTPYEPGVEIIKSFNGFLTESNNYGINYINGTLTNSIKESKNWHENTRLARFHFDYNTETEPHCSFYFNAVNINDKLAKYECSLIDTNPSGVEEVTVTKVPEGITAVGLKLRTLIPALQKNQRFIDYANANFAENDFPTLEINLEKNSAGTPIWTITINNETTDEGIIIKTPATTSTPIFSFYTKRKS